jgi:anti-sigma factor RsiW
MTTCDRRFDESLLSGYLDRALTQGDRQQVEVHVDRCPTCRALLADLGALRGAARSSTFEPPGDEQWNELPRTGGSRVLRLSGWALLLTWVTLVAGIAAVGLARSGAPSWEKLLIVGAVAGFGLLLLSVLLDRLRDLRHDRYRRVQK